MESTRGRVAQGSSLNASPLIFLSAGEASGDLHGANLIKAVRSIRPGARFAGIGGPRMRAEGLDCLIRAEDLAVVGLVEVLRRLPFYRRVLREMAGRMAELGASVFVPVDFPDFNLRLCEKACRSGVPVVYYICPQVWAWRRGRVSQIESLVDILLTIFPFEAAYFSRERLEVIHVGHPLLDEVAPASCLRDPALGSGTVAVLPGSRKSELENHMPVLAPFMLCFARKHPGALFRIPCAQTLAPGDLSVHLERLAPGGGWSRAVEIVPPGRSTEVLLGADAALVASGTSTLQTMICGVPFALFYRLHPVTYLVGRAMIGIRRVGLVNILAEKDVCRELLQGGMNEASLSGECESLLWDRDRRRGMIRDFERLRMELGGPGASMRAAQAVLGKVDNVKRG